MKFLLSICLLLGLATGCGTPRQVAFKTLKSVALAAETARQSYNTARKAGRVNAEQEARALAAWDHYQRSMHVAVTAARLDYTTAPPADLTALATQFINLVQSFQ